MFQSNGKSIDPSDEDYVRAYNYWKKHRSDPRHKKVQEVPLRYLQEMRNPFITPRDPGIDEPFYQLQPVPPPIRPANPVSAEAEQFLRQTIDDLAVDPQYVPFWRGVKILGEGGMGRVGLWEYNGPPETSHLPRNVAVKEGQSDTDREDLTTEGKLHWHLCQNLPTHIVRLLLEPKPVVSTEGLDPKWDGHFRWLIMEYLPLGSLADLIARRLPLAMPFQEVTLWRIFDCLVDGITVMSKGVEAVVDPNTERARFLPAKSLREPSEVSKVEWKEVCHYDLKPGNVMLGDRDMNHSLTPVAKMADFGFSEEIPPKSDQHHDWKKERRSYGTPGFFPPEQITKRWDHLDWETSGVAGNYGSHTNVWAVGLLMWDLATLKLRELDSNDGPNRYKYPVPLEPFFPSWQISKRPAKGLTHGKYLQSVPGYSQAFKDMVYECLYEKPKHRPDVLELKSRIRKGWKLADTAAGSKGEPWEWLFPNEPAMANLSGPKSSRSSSPGYHARSSPPSDPQHGSELERRRDEEREISPPPNTRPSLGIQRHSEEERGKSPPPMVTLLFRVAYIDGPANQERVISRFEIKEFAPDRPHATVQSLKFRIRARTTQYNDPWIAYENMHLQVTSIPPIRIHLDDDSRSIASYGLTPDKEPIYINLRSTSDFAYDLPGGVLQTGISIRFNISSAARQHSTVEFRGISPDMAIATLKTMLSGRINVPVWKQLWFHGNTEVETTDEDLENTLLSSYIKEDGDAITVWTIERKLEPEPMSPPPIQTPPIGARIHLTNARHEHRTMDIPKITEESTLNDLMLKVSKKTGIPVPRQRWRFGTTPMVELALDRFTPLYQVVLNEATCAFTVWEVEEGEFAWVEPLGGFFNAFRNEQRQHGEEAQRQREQ